MPTLGLNIKYTCECRHALNTKLEIESLDDFLNIDNPYFEQMGGQIYPTELQLNKANSFDTEAPFLDLNLSKSNGIVSSKI